jgi:general stress protein 26
MELIDSKATKLILEILSSGREMSLATVRPDGYPQATVLNYASDGLALYAAIGLDSQKAHNIQQNHKVSLTIVPHVPVRVPIRALSMGATASFVTGREQISDVAARLLKRYPDFQHVLSGTEGDPWGGIVFLRIVPQVISLLDYARGFGHTDLYSVPTQLYPATSGSLRPAAPAARHVSQI